MNLFCLEVSPFLLDFFLDFLGEGLSYSSINFLYAHIEFKLNGS